MKGIFSIFKKGEIAFTALESAIVLTAFVVVAAIFAYVVLGVELATSDLARTTVNEEFATSDTVRTTVNEDVMQITSPIELAGGVIAKASGGKVNNIILTLQLATGRPPVDIGADSSLGRMVVSYSDSAIYLASTNWTRSFVGDHDGDGLLEQYEIVEINVTVPAGSTLQSTEVSDVANSEFRLEVKPKIGTIMPVSRIIPLQINTVMNLE